MSRPQTVVERIAHLLEDSAPDEIAVLLNMTEAEVRRIAQLLDEHGPADPAPLPAEDVAAVADEVDALPDPDEPLTPTGDEVRAAAVLIGRATSGTDLDDLAGALGIRHAIPAAEQWIAAREAAALVEHASLAVDLDASTPEQINARLAAVLDNLIPPTEPVQGPGNSTGNPMTRALAEHVAAYADPGPLTVPSDATDQQLDDLRQRTGRDVRRADRCTRRAGCPWSDQAECGDCNGDEDRRRTDAARQARDEAADRALDNLTTVGQAIRASAAPEPAWTPGMPGATCAVCGRTVAYYRWHHRLGVAVCLDCPLTDVRGEDITRHCMLHVTETHIQDDTPVPDFAPAPSTAVTEANANDWPPPGHVHDPFPVASEGGVWHAECECGTRWDRQPCTYPKCGLPVTALHIATTGHPHHTQCPCRCKTNQPA